MKNPDFNSVPENFKNDIIAAMRAGNEEGFYNASLALASYIADETVKEANTLRADTYNDAQAMAQRGLHILTVEEKEYYNEAISSENGFAGVSKLMPITVKNRIFDYIKESSELLSLVDMEDATGITKLTKRSGNGASAFWGNLSSQIKELTDSGYDVVDIEQKKLSAFMPISQDMRKLGPEWLDRYVVKALGESSILALEEGIIAGDGKEKPIGMIMNTTTAVSGTYSAKSAVKLNTLDPLEFGDKILKPLTKGGKVKVKNLILIVNPLDYCSKIFGLTTYQTPNGTFVNNMLPYPCKIIQSTAMTEGKMAAGNAKDYFLPIAMGEKIEYSDDYKFVEDQRIYKMKMYANGSPIDNDSFQYYDISALGVSVPQV